MSWSTFPVSIKPTQEWFELFQNKLSLNVRLYCRGANLRKMLSEVEIILLQSFFNFVPIWENDKYKKR